MRIGTDKSKIRVSRKDDIYTTGAQEASFIQNLSCPKIVAAFFWNISCPKGLGSQQR